MKLGKLVGTLSSASRGAHLLVTSNKPLPYYNCACAKISAECKIGDKQTVNFSSSERTKFEVDGLFISNFALRPDLRACAVVMQTCAILSKRVLIGQDYSI